MGDWDMAVIPNNVNSYKFYEGSSKTCGGCHCLHHKIISSLKP